MNRESILNFFTIGIGPSSSHTVGPMKAAQEFAASLVALTGTDTHRIKCHLFGSLAATGKGHHTDQALLLGFLGYTPETVPIEDISTLLADLTAERAFALSNGHLVRCHPTKDLVFHRRRSLPLHPNGMHFQAIDTENQVIAEEVIYSVGGGFVATEQELLANAETKEKTTIPFPYATAAEAIAHCVEHQLSLAELALANEDFLQERSETASYLDLIWETMQACIERGCHTSGTLPGGLKVTRRAPQLFQELAQRQKSQDEFLNQLDWVNLAALAVNEENAAGGRIVTAPTNGAAGIIPAVLNYAVRSRKSPHDSPVHVFLLTAGVIANLYKQGSSLSGADVGCQGEVGVACSMAAGALTAYLGGSVSQVTQAAEIGMEHNLGLTCDPIGGLVQIPCIERNTMGSIKAINASQLALSPGQDPRVSLDKVIATMLRTGLDMNKKYKETSRAGLAVNFTEC